MKPITYYLRLQYLMIYKSNLKHLKLLEATPATPNKKKVVKVIQLYEERKIPNYRTALTTVAKLTIPSLYKKGEADRSYDELLSKYEIAEPVTGILSRPSKRKKDKVIDVDVILFTKRKNQRKRRTKMTWKSKKTSQMYQGRNTRNTLRT